MRKAITLSLCMLFLTVTLGGCYTFKHTVGNGGAGQTSVSQKQWFILWGLVPITQADGGKMAAGATDYTVQTQLSVVDFIIAIVTQWISVIPMTCTVTK